MEGEEEINLFEMDPTKVGQEFSLSHDETSNRAQVTLAFLLVRVK